MTIELRLLHSAVEIIPLEELQRAVWGERSKVPAHVLITAAHNGGLVAGAYDGDGLAGFVWGFLGWDDRVRPARIKHCSHMLGVHPAYRNRGIGEALKRFQRDVVRGQGIELITWTYDPLLATNAHLNISKLGAVCNTYLRDLYGELDDGLNTGLETDRFQVDWWVDGRGTIGAGETTRYEIPADFQSLRKTSPARAAQWRAESRAALEHAFASGYGVTGFEVTGGRAFYILQQGS